MKSNVRNTAVPAVRIVVQAVEQHECYAGGGLAQIRKALREEF